MTDQAPELGNSLDEDIKAIVNGAIGRQIGLEPEDIKPGILLATNLSKTGRHDKAMEIFSGLLLLQPSNPEIQLGLANCCMQLQNFQLALQAASAAMALDPENPWAYYYSGAACLALGHIVEAKEDLADAVRLGTKMEHAEMKQYAEKLLASLEQ